MYVENGFQFCDCFNPRVNVELMPPYNSALALKPVLVQSPKSASPDKATLCEVIGNPIITKIKARVS